MNEATLTASSSSTQRGARSATTHPIPRETLPVFLTVAETADLLRTSRKAIYAMIERGQLPGVRRVGRRILIRRDELVAWLDHTCTPSQEIKR